MLLFTKVWEKVDDLNVDITNMLDSKYILEPEEWLAIVGRYGSSHIRYSNVGQFKAAFIMIVRENLGRLRAKLRINDSLRNLTEEEALSGDKIITNMATNPDTEPATEEFESLPYINQQTAQKETRGTVSGLYNWKHSVGGQAYNEFLDGFRHLFRVLLGREVTVYERK